MQIVSPLPEYIRDPLSSDTIFSNESLYHGNPVLGLALFSDARIHIARVTGFPVLYSGLRRGAEPLYNLSTAAAGKIPEYENRSRLPYEDLQDMR